jgi:hypothetical protein
MKDEQHEPIIQKEDGDQLKIVLGNDIAENKKIIMDIIGPPPQFKKSRI